MDYIAWSSLISKLDDTMQASALESDVEGLFSSRQFEGLLINRRHNTRSAIRRIEALEADTENLVALLEARLATLEGY